MSISLKDLLEWRERVSDQSGEEARMLQALIARREKELRAKIADQIANVSQLENWKLQRCAAVARRVEQTPVANLEAVHAYFRDRGEGRPHFETPGVLRDLLADHRAEPEPAKAATLPPNPAPEADASPDKVIDLHGRMLTLELRIAATPGITCGIQGVRIMRMVALMSKARSAQITKMRMTGTQAIYRHS